MPQNEALAQSDAVLVIGGGIAGIKASLDLAETGRKVYIIDQSPALGGFLPLLDRQFPTNDCQICYLSPELAQCGHDLDIEVLPLTTLTGLEGKAGSFTAGLKTEPRFIDTDLCTACGECLKAAPEGAVSFTPGLDHRAPTCMRYPQSVPSAYAIDAEKVGADTSWIECCEPGAIKLDQKGKEFSVEIGSVILATGAELFDPTSMQEYYGYGKFEDVVTSLEFERILSASGPTGGRFQRPSDGREPKRIGWIQCVGSRSTKDPEKPYCSSICCMFAMKEAVWALEHFEKDLDATIFFMDMRPMGKDYEQYYQRVKNEMGVNFVRCRPHTINRDSETGDLVLEYVDPSGETKQAAMDMLVLATGFCAPKGNIELAGKLGIELDPYKFVEVSDFAPVSTSKPGVYACGMALGPRDIPDSIMQASAAACLAGSDLVPAQAVDPDAELPPEIDFSGDKPKVGVFLSDFGGNVKARVDFDQVVEYFAKRPDVDHVEELKFLWTSDGLDQMVAAIKEKGLNRVVVAGCSPRSHTTIFEETVRRAGLNRAFVEVANIREQDAWVHAGDKGLATTKAIDLIRMSVAGVKAATPIHMFMAPIEHSALVVGGGVAGMTAALALAGQGQKVYLVERSKELGGLANNLQQSLGGQPVAPKVAEMIAAVKASDKIELMTESLIVDHKGQVGEFVTGVQTGPAMYYQEIKHGVTILATGAKAYEPTEYLYGKDPRVMTQVELGKLLASGEGLDEKLKTVVMIQCVGSRNDDNPACGRICCRSAVKNALWIKSKKEDARVIVLYRDMRTPYAAEVSYRQAREQGVLFVRYTPEDMPKVSSEGGELKLVFTDPILGRQLEVAPSAVVLSTPQVARDEDTEELADLFLLQRSDTGFLLEDNAKYKPIDSQVPGVYLAGSVLAPKSLDEAQMQGLAAAGRALTVLARDKTRMSGGVAKVKGEICAACLVCVRACPFEIPFINADGYSEIDPTKCQGCGICASLCPAKAIQLQGFNDDQILSKTDALLEGVL